jgi:hypothetical protein
MLPKHLIEEFWATVKQELHEHYMLREPDAAMAISGYRAALEKHQVGDMVYHRDPESVAETVAGGWKQGFRDPSLKSSA